MPPDFAPGVLVTVVDDEDRQREAALSYGLKRSRYYKVDSVQLPLIGSDREIFLLDYIEEEFLPAAVPEGLLRVVI